MPDATRLDNQVAVVTGAARGIGRGIALVLAEAGASIVIGDLLDSSETVRMVKDLRLQGRLNADGHQPPGGRPSPSRPRPSLHSDAWIYW